MASRTVIGLGASFEDGTVMFKLEKGANPGGLPNSWKSLACDPAQMPSWTDPAAVQGHGQKLWQELEQHAAVRAALEVVRGGPAGEIRPLFFKIAEVSDAERFCWETLCDNNGAFLALHRGSPIGRMADSVREFGQNLGEFESTLRVMAVLAAIGETGEPEWTSLRNAVIASRARGFDVRLRLLVAAADMVLSIQDAVSAQGLEMIVSAAEVPALATALEQDIADYSPHIMHFFCHGKSAAGVSELQIATALDVATGASKASIRLQDSDFIAMPGLAGTWLVTLNCCETGQPLDDAHSLAHRLVSDRGVPAAIGMLEPVNSADAYYFTAGFYGALLPQLCDSLAAMKVGDVSEIEWAAALHAPRKDLSQRHGDARTHRQWALPILYVRPDAFRVKRVAVSMNAGEREILQRRVQLVAGELRTLPPDAPEEMRDALLGILHAVPPELLPNRLGEFDLGA